MRKRYPVIVGMSILALTLMFVTVLTGDEANAENDLKATSLPRNSHSGVDSDRTPGCWNVDWQGKSSLRHGNHHGGSPCCQGLGDCTRNHDREGGQSQSNRGNGRQGRGNNSCPRVPITGSGK